MKTGHLVADTPFIKFFQVNNLIKTLYASPTLRHLLRNRIYHLTLGISGIKGECGGVA